MAPQWSWDPVRLSWYYFNTQDQLYMYQDGTALDQNGQAVVSPTAAETPRTVPPTPATLDRIQQSPNTGLQEAMRNLDLTGREYGYQSFVMDTYGVGSTAGASGTRPSQTQAFKPLNPILPTQLGEYLIKGSAEEIADPALQRLNVKGKGRLRGTWKEHEALFPGFTRKPGQKFFTTGRVFKVLWPELLGDPNTSVTITSDDKYGEGIATKIRWFVVVKAEHRFCTCLPIVTYNRRGVAKQSAVKSQHAILFTDRDEPDPEKDERPKPGERPMLPGIRVQPKSRTDKLDKMSRIDFARIYTVEHNVKVYDFGKVHPGYIDKLLQQWIDVLTEGITPGRDSTASSIQEVSNESLRGYKPGDLEENEDHYDQGYNDYDESENDNTGSEGEEEEAEGDDEAGVSNDARAQPTSVESSRSKGKSGKKHQSRGDSSKSKDSKKGKKPRKWF